MPTDPGAAHARRFDVFSCGIEGLSGSLLDLVQVHRMRNHNMRGDIVLPQIQPAKYLLHEAVNSRVMMQSMHSIVGTIDERRPSPVPAGVRFRFRMLRPRAVWQDSQRHD